MERSLLKYIWAHTRRLQIWIFVVILVSMPLYFYSLALPKNIINGPIQGHGFQGPADTQTVLHLVLPWSERLAGHPIVLFDGIQLHRLPLLFVLCAIYTALLVINGWFKRYINTIKGKTAERVLRRLRYEMVDRILRFPVWHARQAKPSEIAGIVKDEVEPLSDFIGDSYSQPLFLAGQAVTALIFLFLQNAFFGILTIAVVALQIWMIPRLRRRLLVLGKERQVTAREMAGKVGEIIQGIDDIHANDMSNYMRADLSHRLGEIFFIRLELFDRKFSVKFVNNLLMQLLSVMFYLVGGYFVITGRLDIGALVASIAAYKDLPGPVRGLIDWDQQRLMAQVQYGDSIEAFERADLMPRHLQDPESAVMPIASGFEAAGLVVHGQGSVPLLDGISVGIRPGEAVAVVAEPPESAVRLLEILARLAAPGEGELLLDGKVLKDQPEAATGRTIGYADSAAFLPSGTIETILLDVIRNRPAAPAEGTIKRRTSDAQRRSEARSAGNTELDIADDWIDRDRMALEAEGAVERHIADIADVAGLHQDIAAIGLGSTVPPEALVRLEPAIGEARIRLRAKLAAAALDDLVEPFDWRRYSLQATVAENIVFGMALDPAYTPQALAQNATVRALLRETGARDPLLALGRDIAGTFIEMYADVSAGSALYGPSSGFSPERIARLRVIHARASKSGFDALPSADRDELMVLAMDYMEPRSRFGLLSDALMERVVSVRHKLRETLAEAPEPKIAFNDPKCYNPSLTLADNVLFGRIETKLVGGRARIIGTVAEVLRELSLADVAFSAGLAYELGPGGRGLSEAQRQKLRLARALMKKPDMLILNRALAALPPGEQNALVGALVARARTVAGERPGIICAPADPRLAMCFERALFLKHGRLEGDAEPHMLAETNPDFARLVEG